MCADFIEIAIRDRERERLKESDIIGGLNKNIAAEFGSQVDDSIKSLSTSVSLGSTSSSWLWPRAQRKRAAAGASVVAGILVGAVVMITMMQQPPAANACPVNDDVSCHYENTEDDLPPFTDVSTGILADIFQLLTNARSRVPPSGAGAGARNIFFVHASCERDLTPLQACAVEAASRRHENWSVNVLFAGPVSLQRPDKGLLANISLPNVRLARVHLLDYLFDTPYHDIAWGLALSGKKSFVSTDTILRFTTLYKYDGVVLDMNRIVTAPLDRLGGNFVTSENDVITSYAIGLERSVRKEFSADLFREAARRVVAGQPLCADFTGAEPLRTVVGNVMDRRTNNHTHNRGLQTLRVHSLTAQEPLFRPPTAGPTQEDCPNVFAYTKKYNHTVKLENFDSFKTA